MRTQDALLSLAELVGAVGIENPDLGAWGVTPRIGAAALFAGVEGALGADLSPPGTIGGWLGIEVAAGTVLHLRMVEAIHAAWRIGQVAALIGAERVSEVGGGIGLTAWYARRLDSAEYRLAPLSRAAATIQAYLLDGEVAIGAVESGAPADLLFCDELLQALDGDTLVERLRRAREGGVRAVLSFGHEAAGQPGADAPRMADIAARAGWRRQWRGRHGLKPGYVEEIYVVDG